MKIVGFKLEGIGKVWLLDTVRGASVVPILTIETLLGDSHMQIYPEFRFGYRSLNVNAGMITFHISVKECGVEKSLATGILKTLYNNDRDDNTISIIRTFSESADAWYKAWGDAEVRCGK